MIEDEHMLQFPLRFWNWWFWCFMVVMNAVSACQPGHESGNLDVAYEGEAPEQKRFRLKLQDGRTFQGAFYLDIREPYQDSVSFWEDAMWVIRTYKVEDGNRKEDTLVSSLYVGEGFDSLSGEFHVQTERDPYPSEPRPFTFNIQDNPADELSYYREVGDAPGKATVEVDGSYVEGTLEVTVAHLKDDSKSKKLEGTFQGPWSVMCNYVDERFPQRPDAGRISRTYDPHLEDEFCRQFRNKPWPRGYQ